MIIDNTTIYFSNYRCFKEKTRFGPIKRANVIIGKNNSGKSALLDVLTKFCDSAIKPDSSDDLGFEIERGLTKEEKDYLVANEPNLVRQKNRTTNGYIDDFRIRLKKYDNQYRYVSCTDLQIYKNIEKAISTSNIYTQFHVLRLYAERDISPEQLQPDKKQWIVPSSGIGITQMIQAILNWKDQDQSIVEEEILKALNQITKPDINISRIQTKFNNNGLMWEICFDEPGKGSIPLSQSLE